MNYLLLKWKNLTEKDRVIYANAAGAFLVKGLSLLVSFFTLPAYMHYLQDQQILGIWFTVLSILIWILNFDLGIGNGLRNHLAACLTKEDTISARQYISSAYCVLGGVMLVFTLLGWFAIGYIPWNKFFHISDHLLPEAALTRTVQCTFIGIMCYFVLRLISSILYAMQKSAFNNFLGLITSSLLLGVVLLAPSRSLEHNLLLLAISYGICINLPQLIATVVVFSTTLKKCLPRLKYVTLFHSKHILTLGSIFFLCQILYMLIANTNEFFITQYTNASDVVDYQIYNRIFSLVSMLFMLGLTPVWSMVTKAATEKDYPWLQNLNRRLLILAFLFSIGEFLLIPFLQFIVNLWLGTKAISVIYSNALWFALFGSCMLFQNVVSTITCGLGRMRLQALCYGGGILAKILIIHIGMLYWKNWILVVIANTCILIPYILLQSKVNQVFLRTSTYVK